MSVDALLVPYLQSWPEIQADVSEHWYVYLSMPLIAAFIGYVTKLLALEMLYRPLEFVGVGPFGWQGVVPRRAGKVAAVTIELLTENLLRPEELLDRFDHVAGGCLHGAGGPARCQRLLSQERA